MATLAANTPRTYQIKGSDEYGDQPVIAADIIYEGAAVGDNASGYARPLEAADPFWGFATEQCDNSAGAAGAKRVKVKERGRIVIALAGTTVANICDTVYMSDDATFTLASTGNTAIGKIVGFVSTSEVIVAFEAVQLRSL